jgi:hypothetical protein
LVTRVLDAIIGIALLILVLRVVVRSFQELRSKANDPNRKRNDPNLRGRLVDAKPTKTDELAHRCWQRYAWPIGPRTSETT